MLLTFLIASALYRDGLVGVFTFGAILAVTVYGMAQDTVLIFGVAANVVAAIGAITLGRLEDRVGPKRIILVSLVGLIVTCLILLFARGVTMFWVFGFPPRQTWVPLLLIALMPYVLKKLRHSVR